MNNINKILRILVFFILILSVAYFSFKFSGKQQKRPSLIRSSKTVELSDILDLIEKNYQDTINKSQLYNEAINSMLNSLDPHSYYIPASELKSSNERLEGNFEGIGVQFRIENDTVMIVNTIPNGPSEKVGILAGDRIVEVNGENIASIKITNDKVIKLLKGPKNTFVKVGIFRLGNTEIDHFEILRDVIPTYSVDLSYIVKKDIGYIKLNNFSKTSHQEVHDALVDLKEKGAKKLIFDVRGNTGGHLMQAINIIDEFIPGKEIITYTKGLNRKQKNYSTYFKGIWEQNPLVILTDENSASASEILSGTIQDYDRGLIVGRRTFGKGLVQEPFDLNDGSAIFLTVSKYYLPSGRQIQRTYKNGLENYYLDIYKLSNGDDSINNNLNIDTTQYKTKNNRIVYGGGGITPDVIVHYEDISNYKFYQQTLNKGLLFNFAFKYIDKNRKLFEKYQYFEDFDNSFTITDKIYSEFVDFCKQNKLNPSNQEIIKSKDKIKYLLKAYIARNIFDEKGFYPIYLRNDSTFLKAVEIISKLEGNSVI